MLSTGQYTDGIPTTGYRLLYFLMIFTGPTLIFAILIGFLNEGVSSFMDRLKDGRKIYLLGQGRLINLAAAEGHPASVMDMSFANQALSAEYIVQQYRNMDKQVYSVPDDIDQAIASLKLAALGIEIDELTEEQETYLNSWTMGT